MTVEEHYYKEETKVPLQLGLVKVWIKNEEFEFYTSPPVFSWRKVDKGTITLAENLEVPENATKLLDLGCGYGVIGITAAYFNPNLNTEGLKLLIILIMGILSNLIILVNLFLRKTKFFDLVFLFIIKNVLLYIYNHSLNYERIQLWKH